MTNSAIYNGLLLADTGHPATAVADHVNAICLGKNIHWHIENPLAQKNLSKLDLNYFDVIGIHYSIKPYSSYYLDKALFSAINKYHGVKFLFAQDEYAHAQRIEHVMLELDIAILFTLVAPEDIARAYPDPRLSRIKKITVDTAYAPELPDVSIRKPIHQRTIDVFYRSREFPFHLGDLGRERLTIAKGVRARAKDYHLNVDISTHENDRIYGQEWITKLSNARAVLGTESGSSIWDHDGRIAQAVHKKLRKNRNISYQALHDEVLKPYEGNLIYSTISPRVFEAALLGTPMILFPGRYSGILKAEQHYIPLEKDFSNFDDIINKLKDDDYLQNLADRCYADLIASERYSAEVLAQLVETHLLEEMNRSALKLTAKNLELQPIAGVIQHIAQIKQQYKSTNTLKYILAEVKFILANFLKLLTNRNHTEKSRWQALYFGARRYCVYLFARIRS